MEQERNAMNSAKIAEVASEPMQNDERKMSKKQIIGMVILSLVAIGGVLFGIYGMSSQNEQIAELTVKVKDAEGKATQLETEKITITDADGGVTEITDSVPVRQNPIIKSVNSDEEYSFSYNSTIDTDSNIDYISIRIKDGEISGCSVGHKEYTGVNGGYTVKDLSECDVTGLNGKIYKVVGFWAGQMKMNENIGFIMQDGTVQYFDFNNAVANNDFSVKKLNIDGFVVDALDMGVGSTGSSAGGYVATVFVLSDGSNVKYTESML